MSWWAEAGPAQSRRLVPPFPWQPAVRRSEAPQTIPSNPIPHKGGGFRQHSGKEPRVLRGFKTPLLPQPPTLRQEFLTIWWASSLLPGLPHPQGRVVPGKNRGGDSRPEPKSSRDSVSISETWGQPCERWGFRVGNWHTDVGGGDQHSRPGFGDSGEYPPLPPGPCPPTVWTPTRVSTFRWATTPSCAKRRTTSR